MRTKNKFLRSKNQKKIQNSQRIKILIKNLLKVSQIFIKVLNIKDLKKASLNPKVKIVILEMINIDMRIKNIKTNTIKYKV